MAQVTEIAWGTSLGRRLQTILEDVGKPRSRERSNVAIRWGIELEEDYKFAMEL